MKLKKIALTIATSLLVLVGAVTFLPLRAIAGLESPCNYISDLVATNPLSSDLASTGDDHMRCIKLALKTSFPNVNGAVTATDEVLSSAAATNVANSFSAAQAITVVGSTATPSLRLESTNPVFNLFETDAAANNGRWDFIAASETLAARVVNDASSTATTWLAIDRTGTTVDSIAFSGTALTWGGNTLFTTANDGAGSGLDADLLDGSSSAAFAQLAQSNTFTGGTQELENATPIVLIDETDASANERQWRIRSVAGVLAFSAFDDAGSSGNNAITIDRTGTTVDSITTTAPLRGPNGSASAPAYAFSGSTNTGMYNVSSAITFSSAGTKALEFDATAMDIAGSAIALDDDGTRVLIYTGSGSPEGVLAANVGSLYLRNDSATTLYVKQTGTGNTGWVAK